MTPPVSFRQFLQAQRRRDDPVGDLARDVLADPNLRGVHLTSRGLLHYLRFECEQSTPSEACLRATVRAIREYRRLRPRGAAPKGPA